MRSFDLDSPSVLGDDRLVRGVARELVRDDDQADDAAQEAWLVALRKPPVPERRPSWLASVVRKVVGRTPRAEARRRRREQLRARPDVVPSTDEILEREALRRQVVQAVLDLDEPFRAAVLLRFFEDLPPREIARRLDVPVETVRSRLRRGLDRLRVRLDAEHDGERDVWRSGLLVLPGVFAPGLIESLTTIAASKTSHLSSFAKSVASAVTGSHFIVRALIVSAKTKAVIGTAAVVALAWVVWQWNASNDGDLGEIDAMSVSSSNDTDDSAARRAKSDAVEAEVVVDAESSVESKPVDTVVELRAKTHGPLLVRTIHKETKRPVPNAPVELYVWKGANPYANRRLIVTDDTGSILVENLPVGRVSLSCKFGGNSRGEVTGEPDATATIEVPAGYAVVGRVVDPAGDPVANADILVGSIGNDGVALTHSGTDGRFSLPHVEANSWVCVGAQKTGYRRSDFIILLDDPGAEKEVRLVLERGGTSIFGRVLQPDGEPAVHARLELNYGFGKQFERDDGARVRTPCEHRVVTDDDGRFRIDSARTGTPELVVRHGESAPWREKVELLGAGSHEMVIQLERAVTVEGRVIDAAGEPVVRAELSIGGSGLGSSHAWSAKDGAYRLTGLAPGDLPIRVRSDDHGDRTVELHGEAGKLIRHDVVLDSGARLRFRVVDSSGKPLARWSLRASALKPMYMSFERTDDDGRVEFVGCEAGKKHMVLISHPAGAKTPVRSLHDVVPSEEWVEIRIADDELELGTLIGRVVDAKGSPLGGATVSAWRKGVVASTGIETCDNETGAFRIHPLSSGDYSITVSAAGHPRLVVPAVVPPSETTDLGEIRLPIGGHCIVKLSRAPSRENEFHVVANLEDSSQRSWLTIAGNEAKSEPLAPGRWTVQIRGKTFRKNSVTIDVRANETTTTELSIEIVD